MTTELVRREDIHFILFDWLGIDKLSQYERFADFSQSTADALFDLSETIASRFFLTHYKTGDQREPELTDDGVRILPEVVEALSKYTEAGLFAASFSSEHGGMQLPLSVAAASFAHFLAANVATSAYPMLTVGNARLLTAFAGPALVEAFARPEIEGRFFGTMCLSEPQAGSSLADIATRAVHDGIDALGPRYRLFGNKMWISAGDHGAAENICHLVLAKIPGPEGQLTSGAEGISLFLVPKLLISPGDFAPDRNDIVVAGLNHKMGYRATSNCLLNLGEGQKYRPGGAAGAIGYLVGEPGQGLHIMFMMMNEARLQVGLGAAMLAYRSHRLSVTYASERTQGRPRGKKADSRPVPIAAHPDVRRMLLAQKSYAEGALSLVLYCFDLADRAEAAQDRSASQLLDLLTPIAKTWASEWGLLANDIAIQVHGGYGYTRDFDVEQLYRDNRLNSIHEGTTGIQAIDLVGRKLIKDKGRSFGVLLKRIDLSLVEGRRSLNLAEVAAALGEARRELEMSLTRIISDPDAAHAYANATPLLWALGHLVVGWLLFDQALTVERIDGITRSEFSAGKLIVARYFVSHEIPKIAAWLAPLRSDPELVANIPIGIF
jgi:alkylation response protein AidB-like acyl-CoA dehydrogenase